MYKYVIQIIIALIITCSINDKVYSQSSLAPDLRNDTIYNYNTTLKILDSLITESFGKSFRDSSFYNSYNTADGVTLSQMISSALDNNPELKIYNLKMKSDSLLAESKTYLPDPMFEFELDDLMTDFKKVGMINFYVSQMFPFPGKLDLERKVVLNNVNVTIEEQRHTAIEIINKIKTNFYNLYFVQHKIDVNNNNQLILKTLLAALESKYQNGKGMQQELFKAQIELSKLNNQEFLLRQERKNILSELTSLTKIAFEVNTKINFSSVDIDFIIDQNTFNLGKVTIDKLIDYAFEHRPDLKAVQNKINMAKTDLEMSELNRMPDFSVKLGYKILPLEERNAFNIMLGISIPFAPWSSGKYNYRIQKSSVDIKSMSAEYETKRNEIRNEVTTAYNMMVSGKETMNYYNTVLVPLTENTLKATLNSYEDNLTDFLDLLDSYRMYQDAKLMFYESMNMYLRTIAELEMAAGFNIKN